MARANRLEFMGSQGELLAARFDRPLGPMRATAVFAHCFTCSKDVAAASRISRALAERGIGVLRFDFTGLGHSGGEFANTNFSSNVADLVCAADFLRDAEAAPALLIGHSLGGAAVLAAAGHVPEAKGIVTIGAPADPEHVTALFSAERPDIERDGEAEVSLAGRTFKIRKQLLDDLEGQRLRPAIEALGRPLLVLHAPDDEVVEIDQAQAIFDAAQHPKSFVSLDGADHLLTRQRDAAWVADLISTWADRVLPDEAADASDSPQVERGVVWVRETGEAKFANEVRAGRHTLHAGEPVSMGGDDSGSTPYDLLLASLGACTSMTLRMYAERKSWPLDRVTVTLVHDKIHANDCETCETKESKLDRMVRVVRLEGETLDEAQRAKLLEIADKCPVHRTLHGEVRVETRLGELG